MLSKTKDRLCKCGCEWALSVVLHKGRMMGWCINQWKHAAAAAG